MIGIVLALMPTYAYFNADGAIGVGDTSPGNMSTTMHYVAWAPVTIDAKFNTDVRWRRATGARHTS
ncbi:hypothetical protein BZG75_06810 [Salinivibrio sp. AR640]|nr:hypothetical protein BZG75_06810 [Salinivibrio sp. AR640]